MSGLARRLYRDKANAKFLGVCAGLAEYSGIDPTLLRIGWVILMFMGFFPLMLTAYFLLWLFLPIKPSTADVPEQDLQAAAEAVAERLERVSGQLTALEQDMTRLESYVTSDAFALQRKIRGLSG